MRNSSIMAVLLLFAFVFSTSTAAGVETVQVTPDMALQLEFSPERWTLSQKAPDFLVEDIAEHIGHDAEAQGQSPTQEQLIGAARDRLSANEAFLYNPESGAVLTVDFSPLRDGEKAPSRRSVKNSAELAAQSLEQEEGVSDYDSSIKEFDLSGAAHAARLDATYGHHDETKKFIGIIGFEHPYWIFLYYTDPLHNGEDLEAMNRILESAAVAPKGRK